MKRALFTLLFFLIASQSALAQVCVRRAWLGLSYQILNGPRGGIGAVVTALDDRGPAKQAGIEVGDVIIKVDDTDVHSFRDVSMMVERPPDCRVLALTIINHQGQQEVKQVQSGSTTADVLRERKAAEHETPVGQSNSDPTFNGLVDHLYCQLTTAVACDESYCADVSPGFMGTTSMAVIELSLSRRLIAQMGDRQPSPLNIVEISEAGLNKTLWVKFTYQLALRSNGMIVLAPSRGVGRYSIKFGALSEATADDLFVKMPGADKLALFPNMKRFIVSGNCQQQ